LNAYITKNPDGIYQLPSGTGRGQGHAVILIGYNNSGGGYWIVKNSFGPAWGNGGFLKAGAADL
jgi:C1A family cysteine protease